MTDLTSAKLPAIDMNEGAESSRSFWSAWCVSFLVHFLLLVVFSFFTTTVVESVPQLIISPPPVDEVELDAVLPQEFHVDTSAQPAIGAAAVGGLDQSDIAGQLPEPETPRVALLEPQLTEASFVQAQQTIDAATGPQPDLNHAVKGAAGVAVTGAEGAIDQLTQEIMTSMEAGPTLVVWFFDQSGSLQSQRQVVDDRFDRVYQELGVVEASGKFAAHGTNTPPLLTSVVAFGQRVSFLLKQPTDNLEEIHAAVEQVEMDDSGDERVFTALREAVQRYRKFRTEDHRHLMFVVFTDEAGDDQENLDATVDLCRRFAIPVYVIGVPAPFGQREVKVKWVDPDPKFDQSPQFPVVDQGPESLRLERLQLPQVGSRDEEAPIDSGFGPFALTRICYETGGIYFTVHPNRATSKRISVGETKNYSAYLSRFFAPEVMKRYRPEYVSSQEYLRQVESSRMRSALIRAAEVTWDNKLETPARRFVIRNEGQFINELTEAQKNVARLELPLQQLQQILADGRIDRGKEIIPRWQAGFDLAFGRVLANKVRSEGYNLALAKAKRGMKFADAHNNTWRLISSNEIVGGSRMDQEAREAMECLNRVVHDHPSTPWAFLAQQELDQPLGWSWREEFTQVAPPPQAVASNNPPNVAPKDEQPKMLQPPTPRRPPPRL